jgi:hypothetical protein
MIGESGGEGEGRRELAASARSRKAKWIRAEQSSADITHRAMHLLLYDRTVGLCSKLEAHCAEMPQVTFDTHASRHEAGGRVLYVLAVRVLDDLNQNHLPAAEDHRWLHGRFRSTKVLSLRATKTTTNWSTGEIYGADRCGDPTLLKEHNRPSLFSQSWKRVAQHK